MNKSPLRPLLAAALTLCLTLTACGQQDPAASQPDGSDVAPQTIDYSLGLLDNGLYDGVRALDYVTLPENYGALPMDGAYATVSPAVLEEATADFLARFAWEEGPVTDRPVALGDLVNIDYVGSIDGVEFPGGNTGGMGANYTAGSQELIDDFLSQIIGVMPGETVDVVVTFPDPYPNSPDLSGREALFVTTVNYIHGEVVLPELTDEFVRQTLQEPYGFENVAALTAFLEEELLVEQQYPYALNWLYENSTFAPLPERLLQNQLEVLRQEIDLYANGDLEMVLSIYGVETMDELYESVTPEFEDFLQQSLMCQALMEAEGLQVRQQDVADYFLRIDVMDYSDYLDYYGTGYVYQQVLMNMAVRWLIAHSV